MIIAFSGLDGSGKTTHAEIAADYLRSRGIACRRRHAVKDSLSHFLAQRIIGRISSASRENLEKGLRQDPAGPGFFILSAAKKLFLFLDVIYFRVRYGSYGKSRKKTLVCDRYFYDEKVQARYLRIGGGAFYRIYEKLLIKPDIAFLLKTAPEKAYVRKNEYDIGYFKAKSSLYEDMLKSGIFVEIPPKGVSETMKTIKECLDKALNK